MTGLGRIFGLAGCFASALLLAGYALADEPGPDPMRRLEAVVGVHAEIPAEARTASFLGTKRDGSGVVIDDAGLIVTIGYLITEAMAAEVTTAAGKASRAEIIGFDTELGLGLLRAAEPLGVKPLPIGTAKGLAEKTPVIVAGYGGTEAAQPAVVVSRRTFAGYWEYLLEDAIFTAPPHPAWSGAALIAPDGKLAGIGSLIVGDADSGFPGNMFVPIDRLQPAMGDLIALGRPSASRPWLGANLDDLNGELVVRRVAPEGPADAGGNPARRPGRRDRRVGDPRSRRFLSRVVGPRRGRHHGKAYRDAPWRRAGNRRQDDRPLPLSEARNDLLRTVRRSWRPFGSCL